MATSAPVPVGTWFLEPTFGQRFLGSIIDSLLLLPLAVLLFVTESTGATVLLVAVRAAYEIGFTARDGQTLGKRVMQTRVVDSVRGTVISPARATIRWAGLTGAVSVVQLLVPVLGGLYVLACGILVLRGPLHQGFHDLAAGTIVTRTR